MDRNQAYFRAVSETLSLSEIDEIVGETSDEGYSVGDLFIKPYLKTARVRDVTSWVRRPMVQIGASIQDMVNSLFEPISRISAQIGGRADIDCTFHVVQYFSGDGQDLGFTFDSSWLSMLGSIPARIDIDQYGERLRLSEEDSA